MKKIVLVTVHLLLPFIFLCAQKDYRVVFDLTSKDSLAQLSAIRWATEVANAEPTSKVEVVMFGKGIYMGLKDKSFVGDALTKLAANKNVAFRVCAVALKNQGFDKSQLLPGVETVPDGIYEVISKQREGWGYIKVTN